MQNIDNGTVKINTSFAGFVEKTFVEPNATPEYYLYYRFSKKDTNITTSASREDIVNKKNSINLNNIPNLNNIIIEQLF
jgi:hypothetical protein